VLGLAAIIWHRRRNVSEPDYLEVALLMLFFGQRLAKDYEGAAVLVPYFILASGALWLMGAT